jgi:hypothetical protein
MFVALSGGLIADAGGLALVRVAWLGLNPDVSGLVGGLTPMRNYFYAGFALSRRERCLDKAKPA